MLPRTERILGVGNPSKRILDGTVHALFSFIVLLDVFQDLSAHNVSDAVEVNEYPKIVRPSAGAVVCNTFEWEILIPRDFGDNVESFLYFDGVEKLKTKAVAGFQQASVSIVSGNHVADLLLIEKVHDGTGERSLVIYRHWVAFNASAECNEPNVNHELQKLSNGDETFETILQQTEDFLASLHRYSDLTVNAPDDFECHFTGLCHKNYRNASWREWDASQHRVVPHSVSAPSVFGEDMLESASLAAALQRFQRANESRPFLMVELGAGYARWSLDAIKLGQRMGVAVRAIAVEAEPTHFEMMHDAFRKAGLDPLDHRLVFAAVGEKDGVGYFNEGAPSDWWGQQLSSEWVPPPPPEDFGVVVETVEREVLSLGRLLDGEGVADLVDLDVQGVELAVLRGAFRDGAMRRVAAVHVSTHGTEIDAAVRALMCAVGWHNLVAVDGYKFYRRYTVGRDEIAAMDEYEMLDGHQAWVNPALVQVQFDTHADSQVGSVEGRWRGCQGVLA